jgi:hypothetical protein
MESENQKLHAEIAARMEHWESLLLSDTAIENGQVAWTDRTGSLNTLRALLATPAAQQAFKDVLDDFLCGYTHSLLAIFDNASAFSENNYLRVFIGESNEITGLLHEEFFEYLHTIGKRQQ